MASELGGLGPSRVSSSIYDNFHGHAFKGNSLSSSETRGIRSIYLRYNENPGTIHGSRLGYRRPQRNKTTKEIQSCYVLFSRRHDLACKIWSPLLDGTVGYESEISVEFKV